MENDDGRSQARLVATGQGALKQDPSMRCRRSPATWGRVSAKIRAHVRRAPQSAARVTRNPPPERVEFRGRVIKDSALSSRRLAPPFLPHPLPPFLSSPVVTEQVPINAISLPPSAMPKPAPCKH